jgi:hypothetical protein
VGLALPLLLVVLDEVEAAVWGVGLVVACLAVWTLEGRFVTVLTPFEFSDEASASAVVGAFEAGFSFVAGRASVAATPCASAEVS